MAARLPLIVSQPARRDSVSIDFIENLVACALLTPKLDANLIGDIETLEPGSTDYLCLEGHTRDLILTSFHSLDQARVAWQRLGQPGALVDCHRSTSEIREQAGRAAGRRVYYFQLNSQANIERLLERFQELVAAQSVQLVSLQMAAPPAGLRRTAADSASSTAVHANAAATTSSDTQPAGAGREPASHASQSPAQAAKAAAPVVAASPSVQQDEDDWSQVDQLVDQLDALDL